MINITWLQGITNKIRTQVDFNVAMLFYTHSQPEDKSARGWFSAIVATRPQEWYVCCDSHLAVRVVRMTSQLSDKMSHSIWSLGIQRKASSALPAGGTVNWEGRHGLRGSLPVTGNFWKRFQLSVPVFHLYKMRTLIFCLYRGLSMSNYLPFFWKQRHVPCLSSPFPFSRIAR